MLDVRNEPPCALELLSTFLQYVLPAPADVYLGAVRGEAVRYHEPNARAAASHKRDAVRHVEQAGGAQVGCRSHCQASLG